MSEGLKQINPSEHREQGFLLLVDDRTVDTGNLVFDSRRIIKMSDSNVAYTHLGRADIDDSHGLNLSKLSRMSKSKFPEEIRGVFEINSGLDEVSDFVGERDFNKIKSFDTSND